MQTIEAIEDAFLAGDKGTLQNQRCPHCGGRLLFSLTRTDGDLSNPAGRRFRVGFFLYCLGQRERMLSHLDGYCRAWAENVTDWEAFSDALDK